MSLGAWSYSLKLIKLRVWETVTLRKPLVFKGVLNSGVINSVFLTGWHTLAYIIYDSLSTELSVRPKSLDCIGV